MTLRQAPLRQAPLRQAQGEAKVPIAGQIAEVMRELAMRRNTYPRLIAAGKMRQAEADLCTARMEAVLATLNFCQRHEAAIRAYIATKGQDVE